MTPLRVRPSVELERGHGVFGGDDGGGGDDVFEEVAEVGAAGAGEVGAEVAALAVEFVAGGADGFEEDAAVGRSWRRRGTAGVSSFS